jgi:uroporphyrinogen-III synthase
MLPKVLVTRPLHQAEATAARLRRDGLCEPVIAPLLKIVPLIWGLPEGRVQAVLLTSANAVPALEVLPRSLPVYCVGTATAEAAQQAGFMAASAAGDATALCRLVQKKLNPGEGHLLHLSGQDVALDLAKELGPAGFQVTRRIAYRAEAATSLPEEKPDEKADYALLYSPRTAEVLDRLATKRGMALVCLSPAVAARVGTGWQRVVSATKPEEDSLLETLYSAIHSSCP